jgi:hypothetical protein
MVYVSGKVLSSSFCQQLKWAILSIAENMANQLFSASPSTRQQVYEANYLRTHSETPICSPFMLLMNEQTFSQPISY